MAKPIELRGRRRVTSEQASFSRPAWSPDGRRLVVEACERSGVLYLLDGKGRIERRIGEGAEAAWSPDGERIAFTRPGPDGRRELWLCDVMAPEAARRIAGGDGAGWEQPAWSPDGGRIACASDHQSPAGIRHLWVIDTVQGERSRLTSDPARSDSHPAWSPDGRALAFDADDRSDDVREIALYVIEFETGLLVQLTDGTVASERPCFIDRRFLCAERRSVSGPALVVIDREKSRTLPVGERPDGERQPAVRVRRKGRALVAYVHRDPSSEHDTVWVAELRGLKLVAEESGEERVAPPRAAPALIDAEEEQLAAWSLNGRRPVAPGSGPS